MTTWSLWSQRPPCVCWSKGSIEKFHRFPQSFMSWFLNSHCMLVGTATYFPSNNLNQNLDKDTVLYRSKSTGTYPQVSQIGWGEEKLVSLRAGSTSIGWKETTRQNSLLSVIQSFKYFIRHTYKEQFLELFGYEPGNWWCNQKFFRKIIVVVAFGNVYEKILEKLKIWKIILL